MPRLTSCAADASELEDQPAAEAARLEDPVGLAGLGALGLHGIALVLDATVEVPPLALVVPGLVDYRPWPVGVGVVAADVMAVVTASFWARKWIGAKAWRRLHWLSYAAFLLASAHGLLAGSDSGRWWAVAIYAGAAGSVTLATAWRAVGSRPGRETARRRAPRPVVESA